MKYLLTLCLTLALAAVLHAAALEAVTTPHGLYFHETTGFPGPLRRMPLDDPAIMWSRNLETGIFYSTAITNGTYAYSGSGLNAPGEAAQYEVIGNNTPIHVLDGNEWEVAAAPQGGYWAAVDRDANNNNLLYLMADSTGDTVWTFNAGVGGVAGTDGLQLSATGNILAMLMTRAPNSAPRLLAWDLNLPDNIPLLDYELPAGEGLYARALAMSADGGILAATADQFCHVIETDGGFVRDVVDFQASTDALALSADGNLLMSGFQAVRLYSWDGTEYAQRWQSGMNNRYVGQLIISPDTSYAVSCWYSAQYDRNYIRVHDVSNGFPLWSYTYNQGTGMQDLPVDADVSADGNWFVVGSWGDQGSMNGEAVVFPRSGPVPYYELDMAGSCFSLDLSADGNWLIAAGKHVHANQFGNGGDVYVVDLDLPPLLPVPGIVDPNLTGPPMVCNCDSVVTLTALLYNSGLAPFTVDSVTWNHFADGDQSVLELTDSAMFIGNGVLPGDTVALNMIFGPCDFDMNELGTQLFHFQVHAADTTLDMLYPTDLVLCEQAREHPATAYAYELHTAYPNPFNSATTFGFTLPEASRVRVTVMDVLGRTVEELETGSFDAGMHRFNWDASDCAAGMYFVRLDSRFGVRTQKLLLLK